MTLEDFLGRDDLPEDVVSAIRREIARRETARAEDPMRIQRELALALLAAESLEHALELCLDAAIRLSGLDAGGIYVVDGDTGDLALACAQGVSDEFAEAVRHVGADSARGRLVAAKKSIYVPFEEINPSAGEGVLEEGLRSVAVIPVVHQDRVIACFNIASRTVDKIPPESRHMLEMIGGLVGNVLAGFQAQEALRESEQRYELATSAGKVGVWDYDIHAKQLYIDPRLKTMLGYEEDGFPNSQTEWETLVSPDDVSTVRQEVERLLGRRGGMYEVEQRLRHRDGSYRWFISRGTVVRAPDGSPIRVIEIQTDITEQKLAQKERRRMELRLQQAQKLESLGILAGGIAHDFNSLLTGVIGNVTLAKRHLDPAAPIRAYLDQIEAAGTRAAELAEQMLAYSGRGQVVIRAVDLSELVDETARLLEAAMPKKVTLRRELQSGLPLVRGDATQLRQVVLNLITNASEEIGESEGILTVCTGVADVDEARLARMYVHDDLPAGPYVYLRVSDTGAGMDARTLERIFDPFFTTKFAGRGLGLASVLGIVRGHKGAIDVHSAPGTGTTFEVLLPPTEDSEPGEGEDRAEPSETEEWRGSGMVLIVDDEVLVRRVAKASFEEAGFTALTAADGREAVEVFREHAEEIVAVILDMAMPKLSGAEVFREIRRIRPDVAVVLTSGFGEDEAAGLDKQARVGFVQKPHRPAQLIATVREALDQ